MKLTFDLNHGCHCAEYPLVCFEVGFQDKIRNGEIDETRLDWVLRVLECRRVAIGHQYCAVSNFDYTSPYDLITSFGMFDPCHTITEFSSQPVS